MLLDDRKQSFRFLLHDRDSKFGGGFDQILRSEGMTIVRTPVRAPNANAYAERWIGTLRRECLDRILIVNRRQLEHVLHIYTAHYNRHRPTAHSRFARPTNRPRRPSAVRHGTSSNTNCSAASSMNTKPPHDNCSVRMTEFSNPTAGPLKRAIAADLVLGVRSVYPRS
jgi:putative transposase